MATAAITDRLPEASRTEAAVLVNREYFGRLCTAALLPALEEACRDWRPDLILHDPCEYASAVVAERLGIPHAQVGTSPAQIEAYSLDLAAPALVPYDGTLVDRLLATPYLSRFPASLDPSPYSTTVRFREAAAPAGSVSMPDWLHGAGGPLVYVTFGTVSGGLPAGPAACRVALRAVAGLPARVLLSGGRATDLSRLGPVPDNVRVEEWVSAPEVFANASAVVCHGGAGTTFGALAAGVPLVVVPLFADQPTNARLVEQAGAGVAVAPTGGAADTMGLPGPADVPRLRSAIEAVLTDPSYRAAARRVAAEMRAQPTVAETLDALARA
ncbi:glycosyltransferase [Kitasatospora sp. RB6PN24]|uniref:glycosyltransferase n=1 Tax=Kitasatospora humi TaxID=2893891 RepID=UPI001E560AA5|nr:glycosyltransferase [Kitasatospora humi]MCC9307921.1 glycosyltransferase [Kitasatospora humi]